MTTAEIITIGTEILLGEIIDTNSQEIARLLREIGIDVFRTMSIGDNPERIASAIREALGRAEIVITTGGLGPTVDDPTRDAVALAFGVEAQFREDLWEQVVERFSRFGRYPTENNRKQAYLPAGATPLENPVGTAPAFRIDSNTAVLISLPGVPREMEYLLEHTVLPYLVERFAPDAVLKIRILHTAGVGESQIDEKITDLELLPNPTVGLAAHAGRVDIRIAAKAASEAESLALIGPVEAEIRQRLGTWIYGADDEKLAEVAMRKLAEREWSLVLLEAGLTGALVSHFPATAAGFLYAAVHPEPPEDPDRLLAEALKIRQDSQADVCLAVALYERSAKPTIQLVLLTPDQEKVLQVPYGGPAGLARTRAVNLALDLLRKIS